MNEGRKPRVPDVAPGTEVGPYRVEARLGAGSFGTVFRACSGGELFALKLVPLEELGDWGEREAVVLTRVKHPNAARMLGYWQWPPRAPRYLVVVMEFVEGRRLDVWTRTENPSARQVLRLLLGVARALEAAHLAKVLHRDVKEANIIVREADGEAVLVDFGVGAWEGASRVTAGMMPPGTRAYRSPEAWQFRRDHAQAREARYQATPADDVYALGVTLYWLLTDGLPFPESDEGGVEAMLSGDATPPHVRNPRVPVELSRLCLRLLERRPEARPDARAVCEAAEGLLGREGEAWEQPLCEPLGPDNALLAAGELSEEEARWLMQLGDNANRPRRGRLAPPLEAGGVPSALPAPVPEAAAPAPASEAAPQPVPPPVPEDDSGAALPGATVSAALPQPDPPAAHTAAVSARLPRWWLAVAVGVFAVFTAGLLASVRGARSPASSTVGLATQGEPHGGLELERPTWESGWKVAPPAKPPEGAGGGLLLPTEAAPKPVAPAATLPKGDASVNTPQPKQTKQPMWKAVKNAASTGALCMGVACAGTPVPRTPPPGEPCPAGSYETMTELKIWTRGYTLATFGGDENVTVSEGWSSRVLAERWGRLKPPTTFSCQYFFTDERVYGRCKQATFEGHTYPVCLVVDDPGDDRRGLRRVDDGSGSRATVPNDGMLRAVKSFE